jgi:hypothetical protein
MDNENVVGQWIRGLWSAKEARQEDGRQRASSSRCCAIGESQGTTGLETGNNTLWVTKIIDHIMLELRYEEVK